jgi:hypothetical protein
MTTRRELVRSGLSAVLLGLLHRSGRAAPRRAIAPDTTPPWLEASRPFAPVELHPRSALVQGMPFAPGFTGDPFSPLQVPFHTSETNFPGGSPPPPDEEVDVAIVGGGLSGLATAYFLRHRRPVLFELRRRFGGVSQGEVWADERYSFGGAYFIAPDEGSFLEDLYRELGLDRVFRLSPGGNDPIEIGGVIHHDFWSGSGLPPDEQRAFRRYAEIVAYFADESYPDIPLDESQDNSWILELDGRSLREDLEARMGMPIPPLLAAGIQSYCYSSFDAGWEQISAASGWNFIAAEEFGRWVCPGGNVWVADTLWRRLVREYSAGTGDDLGRLRPGTRAVDVRRVRRGPDDRFQVTYKLSDGSFRSLLARRVAMACSKHVCKYVLHDIARIDPVKRDAMHQVVTVAYLVANVLLTAPIESDDYDVFLLGDGNFPMNPDSTEANTRVVDMLRGDYTRPEPRSRSVLTLYFPVPSSHAMFHLLIDGAWQEHAQLLVPQIDRVLALRGLSRDAVRQVRMSRWGHAMPIARVGFLADGTAAELRRPYLDHVWFVNQDNWALPAFETAILEAKHFADVIDASL